MTTTTFCCALIFSPNSARPALEEGGMTRSKLTFLLGGDGTIFDSDDRVIPLPDFRRMLEVEVGVAGEEEPGN